MIAPKLIISITEQEYMALYQLSESEYRDPRKQAALIIRQELERRGLLVEQAAEAPHRPDVSGGAA